MTVDSWAIGIKAGEQRGGSLAACPIVPVACLPTAVSRNPQRRPGEQPSPHYDFDNWICFLLCAVLT